MKLVLCGYGRMGQEIERLVNESGKHEIVSIQCREIGQVIDEEALKQADVVIDFTHGDLMEDHIKLYAKLSLTL